MRINAESAIPTAMAHPSQNIGGHRVEIHQTNDPKLPSVSLNGRNYQVITDTEMSFWAQAHFAKLAEQHPSESPEQILARLRVEWMKSPPSERRSPDKFANSLIGKIREEEASLRRELGGFRGHALGLLATGVSGETTAAFLGEKMREFVASLYRQGVESLGTPPCKFCLVVLGSLARGESGPYPDLDNMLLIEKKTPKSEWYFARLNQYVADRVWRLGEDEDLGKAGLRFCHGDLNPPYRSYETRYADDPVAAKTTTLERELNDFKFSLRKIGNELTALDFQIDVMAEAGGMPDEALLKKRANLQREADKLSDKIDRSPLKELSEKRAKYQLAQSALGALETQFVLIAEEGGRPSKALEQKWDELEKEMADLIFDIDRVVMRGTKGLLADVSSEELRLKENEKMRESRAFVTAVSADSKPIYGDESLYKEYVSSCPKPNPKDIQKNLRGMVKNMKEHPVGRHPIVTGALSDILFFKHDLYRFPQVVVAALARLHGIAAVNTVERIRALQAKGIFDAPFADSLCEGMGHLVKLRILIQSHFGQEFETISTISDLERFQHLETEMREKLQTIKSLVKEAEKDTEALEKTIATLKGKKDPDSQKELEIQEKKLKEHRNRNQQVWFLEGSLECMEEIAKKEFPKGVHTPAIPPDDFNTLKTKTFPVLQELFKRLSAACLVEESFDEAAFARAS